MCELGDEMLKKFSVELVVRLAQAAPLVFEEFVVTRYLNVSDAHASNILNASQPMARECLMADDFLNFCQKFDELLVRVRGMPTGEPGVGRSLGQQVRPSKSPAAQLFIPKFAKSGGTGRIRF